MGMIQGELLWRTEMAQQVRINVLKKVHLYKSPDVLPHDRMDGKGTEEDPLRCIGALKAKQQVTAVPQDETMIKFRGEKNVRTNGRWYKLLTVDGEDKTGNYFFWMSNEANEFLSLDAAQASPPSDLEVNDLDDMSRAEVTPVPEQQEE